MEEQQIINDILDRLYGNENQFEINPGIKKRIKKEKEEKYDEIVKQINFICKSVEKELKAILGDNISEMQKGIRRQVFKSIQAEVENGNNILDSNGKIRTGKIFDLVMQSREEVLDKTSEESKDAYKSDNIDNNTLEKDKEMPVTPVTIIDRLEDMGLEFSDEEVDAINESLRSVDEVLKRVKENKEAGMNDEDAWGSATEGMSNEELTRFLEHIDVAGRVKILDIMNNITEANRNIGGKEGEEHTPTDTSINNTENPKEGENTKTPVSNGTNTVLSGINDVEELLYGRSTILSRVKGLDNVALNQTSVMPNVISTLDNGLLKHVIPELYRTTSSQKLVALLDTSGEKARALTEMPLSVEDNLPTTVRRTKPIQFYNDVSIEELKELQKITYRFYSESPSKRSAIFRDSKAQLEMHQASESYTSTYTKNDEIEKIIHAQSAFLREGAIPEEVVDELMEENGAEINTPKDVPIVRPLSNPKEPGLIAETISVDNKLNRVVPIPVERILVSQKKIIDLVAGKGRMDDIKKSTELLTEEAKTDRTSSSTEKGDEEPKSDAAPETTDDAKDIDE